MSEGETSYRRAAVLAAIESSEGLTLFAEGRPRQRLPGASGALARAVLAFVAEAPRTRAEIVAHVEAESGAPLADPRPVVELIDLLLNARAIVPAAAAAVPRPVAGPRVLLALCGAVQAAHAPLLVTALSARGYEVRAIATPSALRFVARGALEALTHAPVLSSTWPRRGRQAEPREPRVPHVELAAWPDAMLVWPATATTISRIAAGDCSSLVSATAVSTRAPVLVAPSMNPAMHAAPAVARNLARLVEDGFHVASPAMALEVAETPQERMPLLGGAPPPALMVRALETLLATHPRAALPARLPVGGAEWDRFHRRVPEIEQAWFTTSIDPALERIVRAHASPPGLLWDVGTGHGALARWAAREGYQVVATDVSDAALARASERAGSEGLRVAFVRDDVTKSALATSFDVVVDRATLHVLPPEARGAYAEALVARMRPGAVLVITTARPAEPPPSALVHPLGSSDVAALFSGRAELVASEEGELAGTISPPLRAVTTVLRRV